MAENWVDVGAAAELSATPLRRIKPNDRDIALSFRNEKFGAVSNACNHVGGPLGEGRIVDGCITCPWHGYQYRLADGCAPPPFTEKLVTHRVRVARGIVEVDPAPLPPGTPAAIMVA